MLMFAMVERTVSAGQNQTKQIIVAEKIGCLCPVEDGATIDRHCKSCPMRDNDYAECRFKNVPLKDNAKRKSARVDVRQDRNGFTLKQYLLLNGKRKNQQ